MFTVRLERIRTLSASTRDFRFVRVDGGALSFRAGQFFRFVFRDADGEFERSYSLCNHESAAPAILDLVVSRVEGGRATRLLFDCDPGLEARVTGPFGRLVLPDAPPGRLVMVATSVGLAPYMPMLRELETAAGPRVILLLGVRDRSEFLYGDWLLDYAARHDGFDLRLCLSREAAREAWEADGHVTAQLPRLALNPASDQVMLCGNPAMVDDCWRYLRDAGFRSGQVIREKYVFARDKKPLAAAGMTEAQKKLLQEKMKKYS